MKSHVDSVDRVSFTVTIGVKQTYYAYMSNQCPLSAAKKPQEHVYVREKRKQRALGGNRGIFFLMYITVCIVNLLISTYTISMIRLVHSKDKGRAANC